MADMSDETPFEPTLPTALSDKLRETASKLQGISFDDMSSDDDGEFEKEMKDMQNLLKYHDRVIQPEEQIIELTGDDTVGPSAICGYQVNILASSKSLCEKDGFLSGSNKVTVDTITSNVFHDQGCHGNLVSANKQFIAYTLQGRNGHVIRLIDRLSGERGLLKDFVGAVVDLSFCHASSNLLSCVDQGGNLYIWEVTKSNNKIIDELVIAVKRSGTPDSSPHRLVWCPHVGQVGMQPKEEGQARTDGSEGELARNKSSCSSDEDCLLIVASHGSQVEIWDLDILKDIYGERKVVERQSVEEGVKTVERGHSGDIYDIALSPDGNVMATACQDGHVRFWQVDFDSQDHPNCLHDWTPHDGAPVTRVLFCDDLVTSDPLNQEFWRFLITSSDLNSDLKIWCTVSWKCLQTVKFSQPANSKDQPRPHLVIHLDLSANYCVVTDTKRMVVYVLQLQLDCLMGLASFTSIREYILTQPIISFVLAKSMIVQGQQEEVFGMDDNMDPQVVPASTGKMFDSRRDTVQIQLYCVQTKSVQGMTIQYEPHDLLLQLPPQLKEERELDKRFQELSATSEQRNDKGQLSTEYSLDPLDPQFMPRPLLQSTVMDPQQGLSYLFGPKPGLPSQQNEKKSNSEDTSSKSRTLLENQSEDAAQSTLELATASSSHILTSDISASLPLPSSNQSLDYEDGSPPLGSTESAQKSLNTIHALLGGTHPPLFPEVSSTSQLEIKSILSNFSKESPWPDTTFSPDKKSTREIVSSGSTEQDTLAAPEGEMEAEGGGGKDSHSQISHETNLQSEAIFMKPDSVSDTWPDITSEETITMRFQDNSHSEDSQPSLLDGEDSHVTGKTPSQCDKESSESSFEVTSMDETSTLHQDLSMHKADGLQEIYLKKSDTILPNEAATSPSQEVVSTTYPSQEVTPPTQQSQEVTPPTQQSQEVTPPTQQSQEVTPTTQQSQEVTLLTQLPQEVTPPTQQPQEVTLPTQQPPEVTPPALRPEKRAPPINQMQDVTPPVQPSQEVLSTTHPPQEVNPHTQLPQEVVSTTHPLHEVASHTQSLQEAVEVQRDDRLVQPQVDNLDPSGPQGDQDFSAYETLKELLRPTTASEKDHNLVSSELYKMVARQNQLMEQLLAQQEQLEDILSRRTEQVLKDNLDNQRQLLTDHTTCHEQQFDRLAKELKLQEKQKFERMTATISQNTAAVVQSKVDKTVKSEMKNTVVPIVSKTLSSLEEQVNTSVVQKLNAVENAAVKMVKSKSMVDAVATAVAANIQPVVQSAMEQTFTVTSSQIVSSFERACGEMCQQINLTFQRGTTQYLSSLEQHLDGHRKMVESGQDASLRQLTSTVQELIVTCSPEHQLSLLKELQASTRQDIHGLSESIMQQLQEQIPQLVAAKVKETLEQSSNRNKELLKAKLDKYVADKNYNEAFNQVLSTSDLDLLIYLCQMVNPDELFDQVPTALSQNVLLSLIQHLTAHFTTEMDLKLKYLEQCILALDPRDTVVQGHIGSIVGELIKVLLQNEGSTPQSKARQIRRVRMVAEALVRAK